MEVFLYSKETLRALVNFHYCWNSKVFSKRKVCIGNQTVIFCRIKDSLTHLKNCLKTECLSYEVLTGGSKGLTVSKRKYVLEQFKENKFKVLIATYSFLSVIEAKNVTKVINFEQILDDKFKLDIEKYKESKIPLNCKKNCLVVNFIEKSWEKSLLKDPTTSDESHFFANTTIKSALELINDLSI
ncbi:ATP-dependent RNA helicase DDX19A [Trichonephila inaurata madagascariensis]|uniref:ATP-dependent RNA helicase DDX19A n=1 Tax=Trichonephila inaurata madagascariensis TaxID=2747483 RepID=A0A8X6YEV3_9ARAC|nr:ATP-dependent RNA helicase DDX19A [Trichonephila inaurata madagascariensis]